MVGRSPSINQLRQSVEKIAPTNSRIMIVGPSGAGKELTARTSARAVGARRRAVRRHQRGRDHARAHGGRAVRRRADQRHAAAQGRRAGGGARRHAVHRRDRRHAARDAEQDPARAGRPDVPARRRHRPRSPSTCASCPRPAATSRRRSPPAASARISITGFRWCRSACRRSPSGARTFPMLVDYFMEQISQSTGLPQRKIGERRHGGAAIARLAGQRPPAAQQRRAADDPRRRRAGRRHQRQHAAAGRRLDGAGDAQRQRRRATDGPAAARGARDVRARISAAPRSTASAAISRAPPSSSAWSARRCTASSRRWASARSAESSCIDVPHRLCQRPLSAARAAQRQCRGSRLSVLRRRLRSLRGEGRPAGRRAPPHGAARRSRSPSCASPCRCRRPRSASCCARWCGATACAGASSICRSPAASSRRDHAFPPAGTRAEPSWSPRATSISPKPRRWRADGVAVISVPENRWARVDIKSVSLLPNVLAKQAAREQGATRSLVRRSPTGFVTEGSSSNAWIVTRDGKVVTRPADHGILRGHHPDRRARGDRGAGAQARGARLHAGRGLCRARGLHHLGEPDRHCRWCKIDGRPVGNGAPGLIAIGAAARFPPSRRNRLIATLGRANCLKAHDFVQSRRQLGLARRNRRAI